MQVFTPSEAANRQQQRNRQDIAKAQAIIDTTNELLKEQAEAERAFAEMLKRQQEEAAALHEQLTREKTELGADIARLQKRRDDLLSPLLVDGDDIHSTEEAIILWEKQASKREEELEEESRMLMRRLDDVSTREEDVKQREAHLKRQEEGLHVQQAQTARATNDLNRRMEEFQREVMEKETQFAFRQSELDAEANLWKENNAQLVKREQELESGKRLLADQRFALDRAWAELRRKTN